MSIIAPVRQLTNNEEDIRWYINELRSGEKPPYRPNCGHLIEPIKNMEALVDLAKGNTEQASDLVNKALDTMIQSGKYPGLAELREGHAPTQEDHHESPALIEPTDSDQKMPPLPESAKLPEELSRGACEWLDAYEAYSSQRSPEGYEEFHTACGLWILSTVAARRIMIPLSTPIYTALAIALTARSSLFAKSITANAGIAALQSAGLQWLLGDDETTPQRLLSDMTGCTLPINYDDLETNRQEAIKRRLSMPGQRGWYYDEFDTLITAMTKSNGPMSNFTGLLRKLDGCPDTYSYSTGARGQEMIEKPYLSLLVCMTPAAIKPFARSGSSFWNDGFWARFAFITPPVNAFKNAAFQLGVVPVPGELSLSLKQWHDWLGVPSITIEHRKDEKGREIPEKHSIVRDNLPEKISDPTPEVRNAWATYHEALRQLIAKDNNEDFHASYTRLPDKAFRIAALFASLENRGRIEIRHWARAQEITERWRCSLHQLYAQVNTAGASTTTQLEDDVITFMKKRDGTAKTRDMIREGTPLMRRTKANAYEDLMRYLIRNEIVEEVRETGSRKVSYKLIFN